MTTKSIVKNIVEHLRSGVLDLGELDSDKVDIYLQMIKSGEMATSTLQELDKSYTRGLFFDHTVPSYFDPHGFDQMEFTGASLGVPEYEHLSKLRLDYYTAYLKEQSLWDTRRSNYIQDFRKTDVMYPIYSACDYMHAFYDMDTFYNHHVPVSYTTLLFYQASAILFFGNVSKKQNSFLRRLVFPPANFVRYRILPSDSGAYDAKLFVDIFVPYNDYGLVHKIKEHLDVTCITNNLVGLSVYSKSPKKFKMDLIGDIRLRVLDEVIDDITWKNIGVLPDKGQIFHFEAIIIPFDFKSIV